jgi:putative membrane protein insertion efficiency factor
VQFFHRLWFLLRLERFSIMRRKLLAVVAVAAVAVIVDLQQTPGQQLSTRTAVGAIHLYQATLSKWYTRAGVQCRFTPTCSHYGEAVIGRFGAARGGWMAMKRVVRCGPWTPMGTSDPPPAGL